MAKEKKTVREWVSSTLEGSSRSRQLRIFAGHWVNEGNPDPPRFVGFIKTSPGFIQVGGHIWLYDPQTITTQDFERIRAR